MYGVPFAWIKSLHARAIKHVHRQHQLALYTQIIFRHCRVIGRRNNRTASEPPNGWNTMWLSVVFRYGTAILWLSQSARHWTVFYLRSPKSTHVGVCSFASAIPEAWRVEIGWVLPSSEFLGMPNSQLWVFYPNFYWFCLHWLLLRGGPRYNPTLCSWLFNWVLGLLVPRPRQSWNLCQFWQLGDRETTCHVDRVSDTSLEPCLWPGKHQQIRIVLFVSWLLPCL